MSEVLRNKTLLIVDDEADLREPLAQEFESLECTVFQAKNGVEAFEIVIREKIDVIISDIRMPGGDGIELLKKVKAHSHHCPVVMLITGFSDLSPEDAFHFGAEAVLAKPFDLDTLDAALEKVLTPKEERWAKPIEPAKIKRSIERSFKALTQAIDSGEIAFGRGGFFLKGSSTPARGELVQFQIKFQEGDFPAIVGSGALRWARIGNVKNHLPEGCGIEIEHVSDEARERLLALIHETAAIPFIPKVSAGMSSPSE